jgi:hypothetical protein
VSSSVPVDPPDLLDRLRGWLAARRTRYVLCWLVCLGVFGQRWYHARYEFDSIKLGDPEKHRVDTNYGHTHIDFGGQWVFGRLAATGQFRSLYHRDAQWKVVHAAYPLDRQSDAKRRYSFPADGRPTNYAADDVWTDAEYLMFCGMGSETDRETWKPAAEPFGIALAGGWDGNPFGAVAFQNVAADRFTPELADKLKKPILGGPLYPPTHAFLYGPIGAIDNPQTAYFLFQWVCLAAAALSGWCVTVISRGRIWWSIATTVILLYPGGRAGLDLGQNQYITLAIVMGGWALACRGYHYTGGAVWGLLAFKPVWGLAFILVPVLMRNWRFVIGTGVCGCLFVLLTVPFVGVQGWQEWLTIGQQASAKYDVIENWTNLCRDVYGLPRRGMLDFSKPESERVTPEVTLASRACLGFVMLSTVGVYAWRGNWRRTTGLSAGFLLLGAFLSCYRFMYYDVVLSLVGYAALLAYPAWTLNTSQGELQRPTNTADRRVRLFTSSFPLTVLVALLVYDNVLIGVKPQVTAALDRWPAFRTDEHGNQLWYSPKVSAACDYNHPVDTLLIVALWAWCGWRLIRDGRRADDESVHAGSLSSSSSATPISGERMSDSPTSTA